MSDGGCADPDCTEEHGDQPDPGDEPDFGEGKGYMAVYDASLHYRNGQR